MLWHCSAIEQFTYSRGIGTMGDQCCALNGPQGFLNKNEKINKYIGSVNLSYLTHIQST